MAVSEADVQELAQALLGRNVAPEFLQQFMEFENPAAVYDAMYDSAEGQNYRKTGVAASLDNPGVLPTAPTDDNNTGGGDQGSQSVTAAQVQSLYQELLGRGLVLASVFVSDVEQLNRLIARVREVCLCLYSSEKRVRGGTS